MNLVIYQIGWWIRHLIRWRLLWSTPKLSLLTNKYLPKNPVFSCRCKNHVCYGFSMMISGESPSMLFDLVMTRFEANYNPQIIYDASCLAKEYGYNRELRRFMSLAICTDKFHECNHTRCSDAFKSSEYRSLKNINTEACEQTNHVLRKLAHSTTFMTPKMYLRAITLFIADMNNYANRKKWMFHMFCQCKKLIMFL